jgi:hypothetical protein
MADRPILFSAPMIPALLDGRKTQARRVSKDQPPEGAKIVTPGHACGWAAFDNGATGYALHVPYAPGDRLWVREALDLGDRCYPIGHATYEADSADVDLRPDGAAAWASQYKRRKVPPIHMPRWASRLTLTVTDVRVQRLQDISEADAVAEGIEDGGCTECGGSSRSPEGCCYNPSPDFVDSFAFLWNSLHGHDAWNANQWVVALTFTVHRCNIDRMPDHG